MSPDIAASVRARLLSRSKSEGIEFERTLVRFVVERLLYRVGASEVRERFLLKGASLLGVWLPDPYRATRDVDVLASGDASDDGIRSLLETICAVPCLEDGLVFDLSELRIDVIRPDEEYSGKRARFRAYLGGARIPIQVDLGFGDAVYPSPEEIIYPRMLEQLPAPRVRAYPKEATVAEKFEAMVKLDTRNSRMKDFHDVWALATSFGFDGPTLGGAVAACFERRGTAWTAETPRVLAPAFYQLPELVARWSAYLAAGAVLLPPPARFDEVGERISGFLSPVRESVVAEAPFDQRWAPGGPWMPGSTARTEP